MVHVPTALFSPSVNLVSAGVSYHGGHPSEQQVRLGQDGQRGVGLSGGRCVVEHVVQLPQMNT